MMNLQRLWILATLAMSAHTVFAQVEGLSYEIGGLGEYVFFDDQVGIENGIMLGGEFGFGFGQRLELRGSYQQGISMQRDFGGLSENFDGLADLDVDIRQYGGDIQFNLLKSAIKPYITLGAGVVDIEGDGLDEASSLYIRGGLGVLLTANDRFAWNLFGTVNSFSANPYSTLLSDAERTAFDINPDEKSFEDTYNFTVGTKLTFYLGGRDPDKYTALDRALQRSMQPGLRGTTFEFEPTYSWLDFNEDLPFADAQTIGAKLGVDFGPYFGLRGFYHQGMVDGDFLEFDELRMYGGEMVFNLNEPSGIVPFIILGGGYLDIGDDYEGRSGVDAVLEDKPYAMGGLGLRVPLSDEFLLKGSARSLIMTNDEIENVVSTQDVVSSWNYQIGVEFRLGKKAEKPDVIEMSEYDEALYALRQKALAEQNAIEETAESKISKLEAEIAELKTQKEMVVTEEVEVEKEDMSPNNQGSVMIPQMENGEVYIRFGDSPNTINPSANNKSTTEEEEVLIERIEIQENVRRQRDTVFLQPEGIVLTPEELQEMLNTVSRNPNIGNNDTLGARQVVSGDLQSQNNELRVQNRILELENNQLKENAEMREKQYEQNLKRELKSAQDEFDKKQVEKELRETKKALREAERNQSQLEKEIEQEVEREMDQRMENSSAKNVNKKNMTNDGVEVEDMMNDSLGKFINYKYTSGMLTIGLGEANGVGLGFRIHYGIPKTDIDVVPQVYYGIIGQRQYGFDINAQKPVLKGKYVGFQPYVGAGFGLAGLEQDNDVVDNTASLNLIIGTFYDTPYGKLYFDYTNRNFFNMNQLSAGYIFKF